MPPKRTISTPSTPSKKSKTQRSLSSFFLSPKKNTSKEADGIYKDPQTGGHPWPKGKDGISQEEADALFAAELAAQEEGTTTEALLKRLKEDEEMARHLEKEWSEENIGDSLGTPSDGDLAHPKNVGGRSNVASRTQDADGISHVSSVPTNNSMVDLDDMDASIEAIPFSQDVLAFDPSCIDTSSWPRANGKEKDRPTSPYALLTRAFVLVSATRSRLAITTILTNLLRVVRMHDPENLLACVYLISNHIAPSYDGVELGLGGSIVSKAVKEVTGKSHRALKCLWDQTGDPGDVAFEAKKDVKALVRPIPITVSKLFSTLHTISRLSGPGSASQKLGYVTKLLVASRGEETRFLVRTFHSHLRIQAVRVTIATALARTFALVERGVEDGGSGLGPSNHASSESSLFLVYPEEREGIIANATKAKERADPRRVSIMQKLTRAEKLVREVRARHPNFGVIVPALLSVGLEGLSSHVPLQVGTPISPMLGSITRSLPAMHAKLGPRAFVSEFKYDGQRCQIHATFVPRSAGPEARRAVNPSGKGRWVGRHNEVYVRLFSRHLEDQTDKYPDINDMVPILMGKESEDQEGDKEGSLPVARRQDDDFQPGSEAEGDQGTERREGKASGGRDIQSFIMDAEVVAIGMEGELLPFQTLSNRSRKDVNLHDVKVKVGVFAFDLMFLDGKSLLKTSFRNRRNLLYTRFPALSPANPLIARFAHVRSCESTDPDEVAEFFKAAQDQKCEGIMVKSLDHHWETAANEGGSKDVGDHVDNMDSASYRLKKLDDVVGDDLVMEEDSTASDDFRPAKGEVLEDACENVLDTSVGKGVNGKGKALLSTYEPDKRCESWLKVKKDYVDGLGDSLDLVPIGAWHGMGRKAGWWSPILLAVHDRQTGVYQAVCKCISGFTDAFYKELNLRFEEGGENCFSARSIETGRSLEEEYETGNLIPDVWWKPKEVWEIRGADITISPNYTAAAGLIHPEKGLSIRFPRFMRRREDKGPEMASTPEMLAGIYRMQNSVVKSEGASKEGDDQEDRGTVEDVLDDL
ncbi:ATP-dependent DNA ligase [Violaceomyces palustris]|uniref:ATP-dependent DNA ligase n=1 Tax=Violaceomyces palustris TaxID=1673888 RepID=A0ACD0P8V5_9BASI|nr:ATP-dependent DNA ligase [Violaceomyces palustris]